jgi:ABC-type transport system involved in cytochrome bd biosynthesis fused ATPase/permease subunit
MARALYMNKDIYLIDDYFDKFDMNSMVEHFDNVVLGFLSSRLVFYVSNENVLAKRSDHMMVMNAGEVKEQGSYK